MASNCVDLLPSSISSSCPGQAVQPPSLCWHWCTTNLFSGAKSAEYYKFGAEMDFSSFISMNCFIVWQWWCRGSKRTWLTRVKKEWQKNFTTFISNQSSDQQSHIFKLHLSVHTEETSGVLLQIRLENICNIGIHNEMIFEVQLYSFL